MPSLVLVGHFACKDHTQNKRQVPEEHYGKCIFFLRKKKSKAKATASFKTERFDRSFGTEKDLCVLSDGLMAEPLCSPLLYLSGLKLFYLSTFFSATVSSNSPSIDLYPLCPTR